MAEVHITAQNVPRILGKLTPELYLPALGELLKQTALLGERAARENAPKDTSALARSITSEVKPLMARVYSPLAYAQVMEEGRAPGSSPPPPDALLGWMRRHGLDAHMAFVVARAIGRRGIKGRFFLKRAKQTVEQQLPRLGAEAGARIKEQWGR